MTELQKFETFLFASEDEMQEGGLKRDEMARLFRIREYYMIWLRNPKLTERHLTQDMVTRFKIHPCKVFADIRIIKHLLGEINQNSRKWNEYLFLKRAEEAFEMARNSNDAKAFASALAAFGKYCQLDKADEAKPDYSKIEVQSFVVTADPEEVGIEKAQDTLKLARELKSKYITLHADERLKDTNPE